MKTGTAFILSTTILTLAAGSALGSYSGGSGTAEDPYLISNAADLNTLGDTSADWNKNFKLTADINMSAYTGTQYKIIGSDYPGAPFTGTFDGDGHVIRNLTYTTTDIVDYVGLFGFTYNATIKNLGVEDVNLSTGGGPLGGLVGNHGSGVYHELP